MCSHFNTDKFPFHSLTHYKRKFEMMVLCFSDSNLEVERNLSRGKGFKCEFCL